MELDPGAKALATAIAAAPSIDTIPLELAREQVIKGFAKMKIPVKQVSSTRNILARCECGDIPVRIYTPYGQGPFPVMVFFHGGGWVLFNLDTYDPICTHLCSSAGCIVASVDYRLSPEFKFPAAIDDCFEAVKWISEHCNEWNGDPGSLNLAGDSAGGNLATVVAIRIRDEGGPVIKSQVLIYPATDYLQPEKPSHIKFSEGYGITMNDLRWFWDKYLEKEEDASNPWAAPLLAHDLSGLPPSYVIVSGYDPLRDEGILYAERLKEAGVRVHLSVYEDMIHGFLSYLGILKQAATAIEEISGWIKKINEK